MNLKGMTLEEFSGLFINKAQAIEEFYKLCHGLDGCKTLSLLFNPHRLSTDTEKDDLSVFEALQCDDKLNGLARLYLYNLEHGVNNSFYAAIQRGYNNIQYVNEFPPIVARNIIKQYSVKDSDIYILDPCGGWGGRMIGCASLGDVHYTCCEPSTQTFNGLLKLGDWLKTLQPEFNFEVNCLPYEDFNTTVKFDIALTSPPYYNTEHYSDEGTNSLNRYKTFDSWVDNFYAPLIVNTVKRLKDNGVFILNVGDRKYPLSEKAFEICKNNNFYCERIRDYLSGNGKGKEKFYCISKVKKINKVKSLF